MGFLAELAGMLLRFIYDLVGNYGISIIIFTLVTKLLLFPLTLKQLQSSRQQQLIQPKMKEISEKYKNDKDKQSQALLELYKEHGINPFSGCLPLLIQLPIIIGLFNALREPGVYVFADSVELLEAATHQAFLWIPNLSKPDLLMNILPDNVPEFMNNLPGLMPIISAAFTYIQMSSTPGMDNGGSSMKIMAIIMPAMFLMWGTSLSAGLILYWTISSIFQFIQQKITTNYKASLE